MHRDRNKSDYQGLGENGMGNYCLEGIDFQLGMMKCSGWWWWLHKNVNILDCTFLNGYDGHFYAFFCMLREGNHFLPYFHDSIDYVINKEKFFAFFQFGSQSSALTTSFIWIYFLRFYCRLTFYLIKTLSSSLPGVRK